MPALHRIIVALLVVVSVAAGGCASGPPPLSEAQLQEQGPALLTIRDAMQEIVDLAYDDPERTWYCGWVGNALVNVGGERVFGCCYHWQELVYFDIKSVVENVGWGISGIEINVGTSHEHHAVVIWDPQRIAQEAALAAPRTEPVFVLDAWRHGRADIYPLAVWLELPRPDEAPLAWEDLDALEDPEARASTE